MQAFTLVEASNGTSDEECDDGTAGHELGAVEPVASTSSSLKGYCSGKRGIGQRTLVGDGDTQEGEVTAISTPVWGEVAGSSEKSRGRNHALGRETEAFFHMRDEGR
jgi:hypothetical protein